MPRRLKASVIYEKTMPRTNFSVPKLSERRRVKGAPANQHHKRRKSALRKFSKCSNGQKVMKQMIKDQDVVKVGLLV